MPERKTIPVVCGGQWIVESLGLIAEFKEL